MAENVTVGPPTTGPAGAEGGWAGGPADGARRAVGWSGYEIIAVVCLGYLWPGMLYQALQSAGWYRWFYGAEFLDHVGRADDPAGKTALFRLMLWAGCAALPFQVGSALLVLAGVSGTRPAELGLTPRRLGRNLLAGLVAAVVLVPGVYGIQALVVLLTRQLGGVTQDHPLTELGRQSLWGVEWVLLVLTAAVAAPVWEELLFRGIIQPWVIDRPYGGAAALAAALLVALSARWAALRGAADAAGVWAALTPALVLLGPAALVAVLAARSRQSGGLFAAAVLFAWVHAGVWPSPVPLLWLALGLGWLAWRSGSLAGPVVLHGCFNGLACAALLWQVVR
jgi:membrane protease YdiL (CAAX protease family)